jgi:hypothetical protein
MIVAPKILQVFAVIKLRRRITRSLILQIRPCMQPSQVNNLPRRICKVTWILSAHPQRPNRRRRHRTLQRRKKSAPNQKTAQDSHVHIRPYSGPAHSRKCEKIITTAHRFSVKLSNSANLQTAPSKKLELSAHVTWTTYILSKLRQVPEFSRTLNAHSTTWSFSKTDFGAVAGTVTRTSPSS